MTPASAFSEFPLSRRRARGVAFLAAILLFCATALCGDSRGVLLPKLQRGQILLYEAHGRLDRKVRTESNISNMRGPQELQSDLSNQFRVSIQEVRATKSQPWVSAQADLIPGAGTPNPRFAVTIPRLTFDIVNGGQVGHVNGLDDLAPEQRVLWQFWVARFAFAWTLPHAALKPGQKWKSEEPELSDALIADLVWEHESTYARDDKCPVFPDETCAVFLTQSTLKQKSSTKDSTPEDYRLHGLKTFGTAKGETQVITYISLKSGLVLRANEDVRQTMDVTVMKSDGSNGVHYTIDASSHLETLFVPQPDSPSPH